MDNKYKLIQYRDERGWIISYYASTPHPEMSEEELGERERLAEGWNPLGRRNGD